MLMPSIFNDNLFDNFFDFPFYDDRAERQAEKKLYGHRAANLMKTDIKEKKDGYDLEMDLPGFKKDEVKVELNNGYLTVSAAKGLDEDDKDKETGKYIRRERYTGSCQRSFYVGDQGRVQAWYPETVRAEERSKTGCRTEEIYYH